MNGKEQVVDKRTVTLHVSQTTNLRGRQEIAVSWSGAHPTGGIVADQNSIDAQQEEYPFVLLECRGIDSTKATPPERLSPETCWTQDWSERYQDSFQTRFPALPARPVRPAAGRAQVVGAPSPLPAACKYLPAPTQHWVPFVAADGQVYDERPGRVRRPAAGVADRRRVRASRATRPSASPGLDGRGSADFDVWTSAENASLGCSQTVACALVAVPSWGSAATRGAGAAGRRPSAADRGGARQRRSARPRALSRPASS